MKNIIYFILIVSINSFSQKFNGKVTYRIKSNSDSYINSVKNDLALSEHIKEGIIKDFSSNKPVNFILYVNKNEAIYKAEINKETRLKLNGPVMNVTSIMAGDNYVYYTNLSTGQRQFQNFDFPNILVNFDTISWKLTEETKKVGDYMCHKAIAYFVSDQFSGFKILDPVVAWYAPDIPLKFGIGGFSGLSGLIMEMNVNYEMGSISYLVTNIDIQSKDEIVIDKPTGDKVFTEEEYVKYIKDLR